MRQPIKRALATLAALAGASFIGNASATAQRTFVASTGLDTNACSIAAPCRSFAAAIAKTSSNGEVIVLDSAGYGATRSIAIAATESAYWGVVVARS